MCAAAPGPRPDHGRAPLGAAGADGSGRASSEKVGAYPAGVTITIEAATGARFADVETILGPKRPGAQGCWCLSYRLGHKVESTLEGDQRSAYMAALCRRRSHAPGVLAYQGGDVVGWAGVAPREEMHEFASSDRYPNRDEPGVWVVWCFRVRAGHGGRGVAQALLGGAVAYARARGARAVEGFPVDNGSEKVDRTMASFGVRVMFERAGFAQVAELRGRRGGFPQVVMRIELT